MRIAFARVKAGIAAKQLTLAQVVIRAMNVVQRKRGHISQHDVSADGLARTATTAAMLERVAVISSSPIPRRAISERLLLNITQRCRGLALILPRALNGILAVPLTPKRGH
jgi:hypothetical protein